MKCIFIYNPKSGKGKIQKKLSYIMKELSKKYEVIDVKETTSGMDAIVSARKACGHYDAIIFAGGDGTFNNIITGISTEENRPILGYLPAGTVNDIARNLKISKNVKKALKIIQEGETTSHDVGLINHLYFMYVVAIGTFTDVSYTVKHGSKKVFGKLAYGFRGFFQAFRPKLVKLTIKTENTTETVITPLALIMNSVSVGGISFNKTGHQNDGYFDMVIVKKDYTRGLFNILKLFILGLVRVNRKKCVTHIKGKEFHVQMEGKSTWCIDGEEGPAGEIHVKNLHEHVKVYVPRKKIK